MSSLKAQGNASGTGTHTLQSANTNSNRTATLPDADTTLGYINVPVSSTTIPNSTFSPGDVVSLYNNTASSLTITCSTTTAYVAGTNTSVGSVSLATRGVMTVLFITATSCVITGNVS
jgi:hypothetical protein